MPRPPRIIYSGAIYHIYQRGNNKEDIFKEEEYKKFFLKQLKNLNIRFDFNILAYAIMSNHYHFLIKTGDTPISDIIFNLNNIYAKYYNEKLNRSGHVFESRFNSKVVLDDAYLICLLRYIHRNPVRANIVKSVDEYRWTSHYFYKNNINNFVYPSFILNILSNNLKDSLKIYNNLMMEEGDDCNFKKDLEIICKKFSFNLESSLSFLDLQDLAEPGKRPSLDEIWLEVNTNKDELHLIRRGFKRRNFTNYKVEFIKKALKQNYTITEIAKFLNVSPSAVSKIIIRKDINPTF
ncbi:transposase [Caloramator australicus]|uniref:Transposase IS200-like domain-containing protein n=1 Tax=Caloramator australicus RC3 TaxID=857293 RepID=I7J6H8_9CLOT|nr:transposase [Caloramator australicus]CCJ34514.1 hypothetical protein CAAU_2431 [Caloramator australicus RC3]